MTWSEIEPFPNISQVVKSHQTVTGPTNLRDLSKVEVNWVTVKMLGAKCPREKTQLIHCVCPCVHLSFQGRKREDDGLTTTVVCDFCTLRT